MGWRRRCSRPTSPRSAPAMRHSPRLSPSPSAIRSNRSTTRFGHRSPAALFEGAGFEVRPAPARIRSVDPLALEASRDLARPAPRRGVADRGSARRRRSHRPRAMRCPATGRCRPARRMASATGAGYAARSVTSKRRASSRVARVDRTTSSCPTVGLSANRQKSADGSDSAFIRAHPSCCSRRRTCEWTSVATTWAGCGSWSTTSIRPRAGRYTGTSV